MSRWGYFQTGSGTPLSEPAMLSRSITVDYLSLPCKYAFNITTPPEVDARINQRYGGFNLSYSRLAYIGGKADPWKEATPFADDAPGPRRPNTINRPFVEIEGGVHHCKQPPTLIYLLFPFQPFSFGFVLRFADDM